MTYIGNTIPAADVVYARLANRVGGLTSLAVDGSVTPQEFAYVATVPTALHQITARLRGTGTATITEFGTIAALTNGLLIALIADDDTTVLDDFLAGEDVQSNGDFGLLTGNLSFYAASGEAEVIVEWNLATALGGPLLIQPGQAFQVTVRDNLSALTAFDWIVEGSLVSFKP